jgi:hypothetical protein
MFAGLIVVWKITQCLAASIQMRNQSRIVAIVGGEPLEPLVRGIPVGWILHAGYPRINLEYGPILVFSWQGWTRGWTAHHDVCSGSMRITLQAERMVFYMNLYFENT